MKSAAAIRELNDAFRKTFSGTKVVLTASVSRAEPASVEDKENSFDDLKARIAKTLEFLKSVDARKMEGMEDRDITYPVGDRKMTLKAGEYLLHFSMPNFYFHLTTAYDILRNNGLEIGKADFMGEE